MNDLRKKILETQKKSLQLQDIALSDEISKEKTLELRKEQDKLYKKCNFFKNLDSALKKENK